MLGKSLSFNSDLIGFALCFLHPFSYVINHTFRLIIQVYNKGMYLF